ncbi:helix-turn-helix domain-containing protein [Paenibacillus sp. GCM10027628]|uniref:AraC family transcriptional regulator n=1 Tax=Paenibacillus sp. GCM10027628 TaxID=3273413 RepID=UPI0036414E50
MIVFPEYEDLMAIIKLKKGELPLHISIHTLKKTLLHHHDFVELSYVIEGSGTEIINGIPHHLQPGTCSFLLPHHIHEIQSDSDKPIIKYCCMFDINMLLGSSYESELSSLLFRIGSRIPSFVDFSSPMADRIHNIFELLHDDYLNPVGIGRNSFIRAKLTEAMLLFVRASHTNYPNGLQVDEFDEKMNFWKVLQYMHVHYSKKLTLEWLSHHFRVSTPYMSRSFKKHLGRSFLEYLHGLRVESAVSMLVSTNMSLADIAAEAGFESYRSFSRVFRELRGQTPSDYRNQRKKSLEKS